MLIVLVNNPWPYLLLNELRNNIRVNVHSIIEVLIDINLGWIDACLLQSLLAFLPLLLDLHEFKHLPQSRECALRVVIYFLGGIYLFHEYILIDL